jgi:hypothetical protein
MAVLLPIAEAIGELLLYYGVQAILDELVAEGVIPPELAPYLGLTPPGESTNQIGEDVQQIQRTLDNQTNGLPGIITLVKRSAVDVATITDALANLSTQIANLPAPPSGDANAVAVWSFVGPNDSETTWGHLSFLERYAANTSAYGSWPWWSDPMFAVSGSFKYPPD